jgi:hypothetical protein
MAKPSIVLVAAVIVFCQAGIGWCQPPVDSVQDTPAPPPRLAAYVLPPVGQLPEVKPMAAPFVDDSPVGRPGFFTDVEVLLVHPHLNSRLSGSPNQGVDTVFLTTGGSLATAVSPRFEFGYRLPEQLGEVSLAYRFEIADRSSVPSDNLGGNLEKDRLHLNLVDVDWAHWSPFALGEGWDLRFNVGVRFGTVFFDTRRSFAAPRNGAGQLDARASSSYWGIGPEAGCDLSRQVFLPGLALVGKVSGAHLFGEIRQTFAETTTGNAGPIFASDVGRYQVSVPMLTMQAGLTYSPPAWQVSHFFLGYVWEEFWQIGRLHDNSHGDLLNRGISFRAQVDF